MATMTNREEFDSGREFVFAKAVRLGAVDYTPGQPFPKEVCNVRKLRLFFEQHLITMVEGTPYRSPTARFDAMTLEELRDWLVSHGQVPRTTWDRGKLLEKAATLA